MEKSRIKPLFFIFLGIVILSSCGQSSDDNMLPTLVKLPEMTAIPVSTITQVIEESDIVPSPTKEDIPVIHPTVLPEINLPSPVDQITIQFKPETNPVEIQGYLETINAEVVGSVEVLNSVTIKLPNTSNLPESSIVLNAEPDYFVTALLNINIPTSDPYFDEQYALEMMNIPENWQQMPDSAEKVTVAVIDSGVCLNHPDLQGRILAGYDFVENDSSPQDDFGHGCGVAGIIAANIDNGIGIAGVAPNAMIMPLRVLDRNGIGTYSQVAEAIVYSVDNGAKIINLSLGGSQASTVLEDAVNYAVSHDVTIVAAAGNSGADLPLYPARYEPVISVGALDANNQVAGFSNRGADLYAPGVNVITLSNDGGYAYVSGTSFADSVITGLKVISNVSLPPHEIILSTPISIESGFNIDFNSEFSREWLTPVVSALERSASFIPSTKNYTVTSVQRSDDNNWAYVVLMSTEMLTSGIENATITGNIVELILSKNNGNWSATNVLEDSFHDLVSNIPTDFIDFSPRVQAQALNLLFPWTAGQSWWRTNTWHGNTGGNAIDFQVFADRRHILNERAVLAAEAGTLTNICNVTSKTVQLQIRHSDNSTTKYVHIDKNNYRQDLLGQYVQRGQILGYVYHPGVTYDDGTCGYGATAHLHFEFPKRDIHIDNNYAPNIASAPFATAYLSHNERIDVPIESQIAWNFIEGSNGWTPTWDIEVLGQEPNGYLYKVKGSDSQITSPPLNFNARDYKYLYIQMASQNDKQGQIFFKREGDSNLTESRSFTFSLGTRGITNGYLIDIQSALGAKYDLWNGKITSIRFDPAGTPNSDINKRGVRLEYIRFTNDPFTWNFAQERNDLGWQAINPLQSNSVNSNGWNLTLNNINDPYVISPPIYVDSSIQRYVKVTQTLTTNVACNDLRLFIDTTGGGNSSFVNGSSIQLKNLIQGTQTYYFDTHRVTGGTGIIKQIRLDPRDCSSNTTGTLTIKEIAFASSLPESEFTIANGDINGLIAAIEYANTSSLFTTINLATDGTYTFSSMYEVSRALPMISGNIRLVGNGSTLQLSSNNGTPKMQITTVLANGKLRVEDVIFRNMNADGYYGGVLRNNGGTIEVIRSQFWGNRSNAGGAIFNSDAGSKLVIEDSEFVNNTSTERAGAIWILDGTATITNSQFVINQAGTHGGAIFISPTADGVTINSSTFDSNTTPNSDIAGEQNGGAIYLDSGNLTINETDFTFNVADVGGAIYVEKTTGNLQIDTALFSSNISHGHGGAIYTNGISTISDTTFTGNKTSAQDQHGGAIYVDNAQAQFSLTDSAIVFNEAWYGGGLFNAFGHVTISDSTISNNSAHTGGAIRHYQGTLDIDNTKILNNSALNVAGGIYNSSGFSTAINNSCLVNNNLEAINQSANFTVDATNNWWGSSQGATIQGLGSGDAVSDHVSTTPYLSAPIMDCPDRSEIAVSCSTVQDVPQSECEALAALYESTGGDTDWANNTNWFEDNTVCDWYGIRCEAGSVREIDLHSNMLTGTLTDTWTNLNNLTLLRLDDNQISGALPPSIGNLQELTTLDLSNNQFSDGIPANFSNLDALYFISLLDNQLSGNFPSSVLNMDSLGYLQLANNNFDGSIPAEIGYLSTLEVVALNGNYFNGSIPYEIGNLPDLSALFLNNNALEDGIPLSLTNLESLIILDVGFNKLFAYSADLLAYLNTKDPDWKDTQTIAVENFSAHPIGENIQLSWSPIPYIGNDGYYVISSVGEVAFVSVNTDDKTANSYLLTGLSENTAYEICIQTYTPAHDEQKNDLLSECSIASATTSSGTYVVDTQLQLVDLDTTQGIFVGEQFDVQVFATDVTQLQSVFSFYTDITFDPQIVRVDSITYPSAYANAQTGNINNSLGEINEVGATGGLAPVASHLIFTIHATALQMGSLTFSTNQPEDNNSEIGVYNSDADWRDQTNYDNLQVKVMGYPDLAITAFDVTPDHLIAGIATVNFTIANNDDELLSDFGVSLIYSRDNTIGNGDDLEIENVILSGIDGNSSQNYSINIQLSRNMLYDKASVDDPPEKGINYQSSSQNWISIVIDKDNLIEETNEENNVNSNIGIGKDNITYFPWDISQDGTVQPTDAIYVINRLQQLVTVENHLADVKPDGNITPTDALSVINRIGYKRNDLVIESQGSAILLQSREHDVSPLANSVNIQLEVKELDNTPGITERESFQIIISGYATDNPLQSLFSAYMDVLFDSSAIVVDSITYSPSFQLFHNGQIKSNLLENIGGMSYSLTPFEDTSIITLTVHAIKSGTTLVSTQANSNSLSQIVAYGNDNDLRNNTTWGALTIEISDNLDVASDSIGLYQNGQWIFRDGIEDTAKVYTFSFGPYDSGWIPLTGDWNGDGVDGIGLYKNGIFILRNVSDRGPIDYLVRFGNSEDGWLPVVGDWNGDSVDTVGLYRNSVFMITNSHNNPKVDYQFIFGNGESGWVPLAGDWSGLKSDRVGLYRNGIFMLHNTFETQRTPSSFIFGPTDGIWTPINGDWNQDGITTIGLYRDSVWRLRNSNSSGKVDIGLYFGNFNGIAYPLTGYRGGSEALEALGRFSEIEVNWNQFFNNTIDPTIIAPTATSISPLNSNISATTPEISTGITGTTNSESVITPTIADSISATPDTFQPTMIVTSIPTSTEIAVSTIVSETSAPVATVDKINDFNNQEPEVTVEVKDS